MDVVVLTDVDASFDRDVVFDHGATAYLHIGTNKAERTNANVVAEFGTWVNVSSGCDDARHVLDGALGGSS